MSDVIVHVATSLMLPWFVSLLCMDLGRKVTTEPSVIEAELSFLPGSCPNTSYLENLFVPSKVAVETSMP